MVPNNMDALEWLRKHLDAEGSDLLREMVRTFAERLMAAEVEVLCNAGYGEITPERTNSRNGYRPRQLDTRVGSIDLLIPKLREGSYYPGWLLEPWRRAERALVAVVAECYVQGVSTRRVEKLVQTLGIERPSKPGVADGHRARCRGRGVPQPAPGRRPVHLRVAGRVDPEGARGRPDRQRRGGDRRRGQRRRAP
jgi:putative transposase